MTMVQVTHLADKGYFSPSYVAQIWLLDVNVWKTENHRDRIRCNLKQTRASSCFYIRLEMQFGLQSLHSREVCGLQRRNILQRNVS